MKKNRDSSVLAARIAAAASQPAGTGSVVQSPLVPLPAESAPVTAPADLNVSKAKAKELETVPITLRPSSALLTKFVLKASERTREEGRVVSAQQIMLEALERSV